jgi:hypothetical protein
MKNLNLYCTPKSLARLEKRLQFVRTGLQLATEQYPSGEPEKERLDKRCRTAPYRAVPGAVGQALNSKLFRNPFATCVLITIQICYT